ncbi:prephenate dehydrogenase/arogenate dehydrogenase family protein [Geothrix sp. PMB-07]|uniref:prephenate dehydrogenase/arogenate dehydrogenase family protein n=1 Tax=Geothrix sp. PMB-07 TaxID=3068640 RepID=UPI0027405B7C|nr:prephenate dehydrogenase/arogenate dehydrogenase family protein [Geothrix sp. PMB-07]WLT31375.1 prephenate dehydrogenase/arogenate dehydrogenase family protein [Geothrix sp. PMB-07]
MRIGILGYGRFGRALGALLREAGHSYRAWDAVGDLPVDLRAGSARQLVEDSDTLVLAVPVPALAGALRDLRPHLRADHLVFDVGSVKVGPCAVLDEQLGVAIPHVGTHPLFGPVSLARAERPLRVVLCPSAHHPAAALAVEALFQGLGCEVLRQPAEDHDRVMATTHALTFFIAKGLLAVGAGAELPFTPPSFHAIARTLESVREDAGHLFAALQNQNPFAAGAREGLLEALSAIHQSLAEAVASGAADEQLSIPDLGARSPALQEARDHIDALDQELVALLARRTELVLRAGRAKAELNLPVHDPEREAAQLQARRAWAQASGLDGQGVEEVFRAVLRASRSAQGSAGEGRG